MTRFSVLVLALVATVSLSTPQAVPKAHVEGVVLDGLTGAPLADVTVMGPGALPATAGTTVGGGFGGFTVITSNDIPKDLKTDAQGRFSLDLNSGSITLTASKIGYRPARLEGRKLPGNNGIPLNLEAGQRLTGLTLRLFPQPVVTGKVFDQRGQPMQDAEVQPFIYIYNDAGVRTRSNPPGGAAKTNDLGDFRIENLDPGEYFFEIRPASSDLGGTSGSLLAPLYYPGTTDVTKADPVPVAPGARVQLRNITALPVRGGTLHVKLANQGDEPRGASILSVFREGETGVTVKSQMIQKDVMTETVDLGRLLPGRYFMRAGFAGVNSGINEGRVMIDIGESDQQINLPIVTFKPWMFSGRAIVELPNGESRPIAGVQLAFYDVGPNAQTAMIRPAGSTNPLQIMQTSAADGVFPSRALNPSMPPYAFHVRVLNPPPGMYVSIIRGGSSTRELRAEYGSTTNLTVVLAENAGTIEGTLTDAKGGAVPAGSVVLLPDNPNEVHRLVTGTTATNGTFRLQAGPGAYRLYAWTELAGAPYMNATYMQTHRESGVPVRVESGGRSTVNAKVLED
jgi:hypothetical protein